MATLLPQIVTSNHLLEGDVIYFKDPDWIRNIEEAKVPAHRGGRKALTTAKHILMKLLALNPR